ncbi:1-acyl-sn-glycerol-3-phosphate acyltransferase [Fundidesulfovibrio magnetotacticus]|uniref:1-acyl-sn-glycerol-3-phosphate acyltransferase n=1 Tax=Fundidesulfovibrio magnetotacticus TaxID=2730080 RepID=A0A6V8LXI7_9BACT|nr:lysophospholipid acyltransferase family protein [Fundidesulfovibrio magnetotacticus]GFK94779.1 1-acyl-sn-glycerol-3-phosphate acyltransferase [Fundidesulfovibrio magnetotacticus]
MVHARKILFLITFPVLTAIVSCLCWLMAPLGTNARPAHAIQCAWARLGLLLAGVRVQADLSRLDPSSNYVFMANHQSHFDILALFAVLHRWNLRFVAKEELFKIPLFGPAMRRTGHIAILRENSRKAMRSIDEAVDAAKRGLSILIFPEGTRARTSEHLGDFKIGGMIMALKCGLPVAPLIITGTRAVLPRGATLPSPGVVRVEALEPFQPAERFTLKQREHFKDWFKGHMDQAYQERRP